jgi:hypothetical protein
MRNLFITVLFLLVSCSVWSRNDEVRRKIDIDRRSLSWSDETAYEKSREFKRLDSTYYIGSMYEGAYLYSRANDAIGFRNAIIPLKKAFQLIQADYDAELRTRTADVFKFFQVNAVQNDFCLIGYWLQHCYQNIERPQEAVEVIRAIVDRDIQMEYGIESYNALAWIYHRNRMFTTSDFPFLKNTVEENNKMAYAMLDSAILKYQRDAALNIGFYDSYYLKRQYYYTYHYKVILFTYDMQIDSAEFYYDILLRAGYYSSNNYGNFRYMNGDFVTAAEFYQEAEDRDRSSEKHTKEYFYMRGLLGCYAGKPDSAASLLSTVIEQQGVTPGFGWHNIGLARAYYYQGLTSKAQELTDKAARFDELHIGTTWGPEQYGMCVAAFNYLNKERERLEHEFENDQWWYWLNPMNWVRQIRYSIQVNHYRLLLTALLSANPERNQIVYTLFSSESLLGFDEVLGIINGFSDKYFIQVYEDQLAKEPRERVKKYIRLFLARLYLNEDRETNALEQLDKAYEEITVEDLSSDYDILLFARVCEAYAMVYTEQGNETLANEWALKMYRAYPQLMPFSSVKIKMQLQMSGAGKEREHIEDALEDCDLNWTDDTDAAAVQVDVIDIEGGTMITYTVHEPGSATSIMNGTLKLDSETNGNEGKIIAYRLFGVLKEQIKEDTSKEEGDKVDK